MHKIEQLEWFLVRLLEPLLKHGLLLMKNVLKELARFIPLGLTAAWAIDAAIYKKMFGSGETTLIISNEEINDIMRIVKSLEESCLFIKGVSKTIKNEAKEQRRGFLGMLLETLNASLLENLLPGKGAIRSGEDTVRTGQDFECPVIF